MQHQPVFKLHPVRLPVEQERALQFAFELLLISPLRLLP